uniref:Uncharacterized protein n=1 Tax=Arundo donax TaxID=35708 RepID=A0A0A9GI64_ARUDO
MFRTNLRTAKGTGIFPQKQHQYITNATVKYPSIFAFLEVREVPSSQVRLFTHYPRPVLEINSPVQ